MHNFDWRETLNIHKYSKLPGICSLHDPVFARSTATGKVVCKTRPLCYERNFTDAKLHKMSGCQVEEDVVPDETHSYWAKE